MKNYLLKSKKRNFVYLTSISFLIVCIIMGFVCFKYYFSLQNTVRSETSGYMQEISKQIGTNASKTINDNFSILKTISTVLNNTNINSFKNLQNVIQEHQTHWDYVKVMLIDENGTAYDDKGNSVTLNNSEYLQDVIVSKKQAMSTSQVIDGKECAIFAIPIEGIKVGDKTMYALAGVYDISTFDNILSMTAFDNKGYAHIIRKDGTVVIRSSSPNALETGYNILNSLSLADIKDNQSVDIVCKAIENGDSGQIEFLLNGNHQYMTYTPLVTNEWCLLTFVPVSVVNEKSNMLLNVTLLICLFITLAFSILFLTLLITYYSNKRKLEHIAYVDNVTEGNTIDKFNELASELLKQDTKQYALIFTNIEKFKVLNEQFGRDACNELLKSIQNGISLDIKDDECMGRLFADNFCILINYTNESDLLSRFDLWQRNYEQYMEHRSSIWMPLTLELGVFIINNNSMPLSHMIDRAKLALVNITHKMHKKIKYSIYDEHIRNMLFREKHLEDIMDDALANNEFEVYLQPKYLTHTEEIGGAEALVRWNSSKEGMIYPDEFIPLFEKNAFILQLDFYIFESVCKHIRKWLDMGLTPVKISVNCSRMHLNNCNFIDTYVEISKKYDIPNKMIEIELTENTVFENVDTLSHIIRQIHIAGFGCSMDDFGSGYSSLNLIQDIPVDTIKLDKIFFSNTARDIKRTESVVGSIISMSKALSMETVAEGVEDRNQVNMLKKLNCDYIQGYYFAKPMPIHEFEKLAFKNFTSMLKDM